MQGFPQRSNEDKRKKSRSGCSSCKSRRIKCDETYPGCQQCHRRYEKCPGYSMKYKWSSKYEITNAESLHKSNTQKSRRKQSPQYAKHIAADVTLNHDHSCQPEFPISSETTDHQSEDESSVPTRTPQSAAGQLDLQQSPHSASDLLYADPEISASVLSSMKQPWPTDIEPAYPTPSSQASQDGRQRSMDFLCENIFSNSSLIVAHFSQNILKNLCLYDSRCNPFRAAISFGATDAMLYCSLLRYLTLSYHTTAKPTDRSQILLGSSQNELLHHLHDKISKINHYQQTKWESILLVFIMYGLANGWDGSDNTGRRYYNIAIKMLKQRPNMRSNNRQFFNETLIYWWMGLALTTDSTDEPLLEPPVFDPQNSGIFNGKRVPHPLTGVTPQAHFLLGKAGALLFSQRVRALGGGFASINDLLLDRHAIHSALDLERELCSLEIPSPDAVVETDKRETSVHDLACIAECYRLCALLILYRGFPDLRQRRFAEVSMPDGDCSLNEESWLCSQALQILDILSRSTPGSGTRSSEQILLIIIAGELRLQRQGIFLPDMWSAQDHFDPSSLFAGAGHVSSVLATDELAHTHTNTQSYFDQPTDFPQFVYTSNPSAGLNDGKLSGGISRPTDTLVRAGREKICDRLTSVQESLPYKSVERVKGLIEETWYQNDHKMDTFWMDILIRKGWKIQLV